MRCLWCRQELTRDRGVLVDETGGDVCGVREAQDDTLYTLDPLTGNDIGTPNPDHEPESIEPCPPMRGYGEIE